LTEIITNALRAPSAMNVQPWEMTVVTGDPLNAIRDGNMEMLSSGVPPRSDFGEGKPVVGVHKERARELGLALYSLMGIDRADMEKRTAWTTKGFRAFDAPAMIILTADEVVDTRLASEDIGGIVQTLCLLALDYGLGTCVNSQGILFPDVIRKATGIPAAKKLYICIAIGYPDWGHPANKLESKREVLDNVVTWVGF
jgi:nitroreductase